MYFKYSKKEKAPANQPQSNRARWMPSQETFNCYVYPELKDWMPDPSRSSDPQVRAQT